MTKDDRAGARGPAADERRKPQTLAERYVVENVLGRGGMATVYCVFDRSTQRRLALKQLEKSAVQERPGVAVLFQREYYFLTQLAHPRIIEVYDYGVDDGAPFYTMELLDGSDLRQSQGIEWRRACELLHDVASSLAVMHARRLVHRDVTPANVRCTSDGRAKLIDFGALAPMGTVTDIVGTPPFVAPEALNGQLLDGRTDLYSMGALAYWMLTGRHAYPARTMGALRQLWRTPPAAPSSLCELPEALERLVLALLSQNPLARPVHAGEVLSRLETIAGLVPRESEEVAQAYLTTPALVGREREIRAFRRRVSRAKRRTGGSLLIRGGGGAGKTRLLHAFVVEGRLAGAAVLRAGAKEATGGGLAVVAALVHDLLDVLSGPAIRAVEGYEDALCPLLPELAERLHREGATMGRPAGREPPAAAPSDAAGREERFFEAFGAWLRVIANERRLVVVVDDLHACEADSAAALAALVHATPGSKLWVAASVDDDQQPKAKAAVDFIAGQSATFTLSPLSREQTGTLFASLFGSVSNVVAAAEWAHHVSRGNPGGCMSLAQHLVDAGIARYRDGGWSLPEDLARRALPEDLEDALRSRLDALSPPARTLAEALALANDSPPLDMADYAVLLRETAETPDDAGETRYELFEVLDELLRSQVVAVDGERYLPAQRVITEALLRNLPPDRSRAIHRSLSRIYDHKRALVSGTYHLQLGEEREAAFDRILHVLRERRPPSRTVFNTAPLVLSMCEKALAYGEECGRSPEQLFWFRRALLGLGTVMDPAYGRYAPCLLEQLRRETGFVHWPETEHIKDAKDRIQRCLDLAGQRYDALVDSERGLAPDEALKQLGQVVSATVGNYARVLDFESIWDLVEETEPLAAASPYAALLHEVVQITADAVRGTSTTHRRHAVIDRLDDPALGIEHAARQINRAQFLYYSALEQALTDTPTALELASLVEQYPLYGALAWNVRHVAHLFAGDSLQARACLERRQLLGVHQVACASHVAMSLIYERAAYVLSNDLNGIKRAMEFAAAQAALYPRWQVVSELLMGDSHMARHDYGAARAHYESVFNSEVVSKSYVWVHGIGAYLQTLVALGEHESAISIAREAAARFAALDVTVTHRLGATLAHALALAHLERHEEAAAVLDGFSAALPPNAPNLVRGALWEARARVALVAEDWPAFDECAERTAAHFLEHHNPSLVARYEQLVWDAERKRSDSLLKPDGDGRFEEQQTRVLEMVRSELAQCSTPNDRARRALALLAEEVGAVEGHLYLMSKSGVELAGSHGEPTPPSDLSKKIEVYLGEQVSEMTQTCTASQTYLETEAFACDGERTYYPYLLQCIEDEDLVIVGVAAMLHDETAAKAPPVDLIRAISYCFRDALPARAQAEASRV